MKITKTICKKVLKVVDAGLCSGKGKPVPGEMCVEEAVTFALGEEFSDEPSCVSPVLRSFKIALNDKYWSSKKARAEGLRRIAIAQLGTKDTLDEKEFVKRLAEMTIRKTVPEAIRLVAEKAAEPHKTDMLAAALECEQVGTRKAAQKANIIVRKYAVATYAATYADAATAAATYAVAARDKVLAKYAENVVQILIDMKTPGSLFLSITEGKK